MSFCIARLAEPTAEPIITTSAAPLRQTPLRRNRFLFADKDIQNYQSDCEK
jgi:hypothetical protein